jgi:carbonic anhydrase
MISAEQALRRLQEGNARYVAGEFDAEARDHGERRRLTVGEQHPVAAVLACSDSRVPVDVVFDQGIGDLFVVRVAGNVVGRSQRASIEFAADHLEVPLVLVLGHSDCGAVKSVIDWVRDPGGDCSATLEFFVNKIGPPVERLLAGDCNEAPERIVANAVRENVRHSVERLQKDSEVIRTLADSRGLRVVGAEYSLQTGIVEFI